VRIELKDLVNKLRQVERTRRAYRLAAGPDHGDRATRAVPFRAGASLQTATSLRGGNQPRVNACRQVSIARHPGRRGIRLRSSQLRVRCNTNRTRVR